MLLTSGDVIKFWDPNSYELKQVVPSSYGNVKQVSWNHDGGCLGIVSEKSKDVCIKVVKGYSALDYSIINRTNPVTSISFARRASHSQFLAVADASNKVLVWNIKQNCQNKIYTIKDCPSISSISFSPSDSHIAAGSTAGSVYLMSATNNTISKAHAMFADKSRVLSLSYGTVKRSVIGVTSSTGKVSVLDADTGVVNRLQDSHSAPCSALAFSPINEILMVSVGYDKKMLCHNLRSNKKALHLSTPTPLTCASFLPGGVHVCLGSLTGEVFLYDIRTLNEPLKRWQAHATAVSSVSLQPAPVSDRRADSSKKRTVRKEKTDPSVTVPPVSEVQPPIVEEGKKSRMQEFHDLDVLSPVKEYNSNVSTNQATHITPMKLNTVAEKFDYPVDDVLSPVKETGVLSPVKVSSVLSPVNGSDVLSPVKGPSVLSPVKETGVLSPVKGSGILSPVKRSVEPSSVDILSPVKKSFELSKVQDSAQDNQQKFNTSASNATFEDDMISPVRNSNYSSISVISPLKNDENMQLKKNTSVLHQNMKENVPPTRLIENENRFYDEENVTKVEDSSQSNRKKLPLKESNFLNIPKSNEENFDIQSSSKSMEEIQKKYNKIVNRMKKDEMQSVAKPIEQSSQDLSHQIDYERLAQLVADKLKTGQSEPRGSASMSTSLISNAVKDLLEEVELNINRRFMHLQYTMITQFMSQTKELEELHKKYSLNEALVEENLKLQEEIKFLKRQY